MLFEPTLLPEPVEVTDEILGALRDDNSFSHLAFELYKETAILLAVISHSFAAVGDADARLSRNQAICAGLLVRINKFLMAVMELTTKDKYGEIVLALNRSILESVVNLRFLLHVNEDKLWEQFVLFSLSPERELYDRIRLNIENRAGQQVLPIEHRMLESIQRVCALSGVKIEDVNPKHGDWGGGVKNRLAVLGAQHEYVGVQRIPSHAVHGTWVDLALHHLKEVNGGFVPDPSWTTVDTRSLLPVAIYLLDAGRAYLRAFIGVAAGVEALYERIEDIQARIKNVESAHEEWLAGNHKT